MYHWAIWTDANEAELAKAMSDNVDLADTQLSELLAGAKATTHLIAMLVEEKG